MSAPTKLTPDQVRWARQIMAKREDLRRQLDLLPTLEDMAEDLRVSERHLRDVVHLRARLEIVEVALVVA